jgi:hypothetical protein
VDHLRPDMLCDLRKFVKRGKVVVEVVEIEGREGYGAEDICIRREGGRVGKSRASQQISQWEWRIPGLV